MHNGKEIHMVMAVADNGVLGFAGEMPWDLPTDRKRFRDLTMGHSVIMGRKTYESLPDAYRPLTGRRNIVLTKGYVPDPGIFLARNLEEAVNLSEGPVMVAGGGEVYKLFLPYADRIYLTQVHAKPIGDTYFDPDYMLQSEWKLRMHQMGAATVKDSHPFSFNEYRRVYSEVRTIRSFEACLDQWFLANMPINSVVLGACFLYRGVGGKLHIQASCPTTEFTKVRRFKLVNGFSNEQIPIGTEFRCSVQLSDEGPLYYLFEDMTHGN